ncbi:MAG: hypothetical protein PHW90_00585 [Bacilli bacterium]|nr:hypothetical protein [Bacilli bacterium]
MGHFKYAKQIKIDTNVLIYQNWFNNNESLVNILDIEYFGNQFTLANDFSNNV